MLYNYNNNNNNNNNNNRYLQRRSDRGQILGPSNSGSGVRVLCPDCKERLYILPQDQDNYICLECGQKFPGNEVYEHVK
jgi:ribosomal protein S27E